MDSQYSCLSINRSSFYSFVQTSTMSPRGRMSATTMMIRALCPKLIPPPLDSVGEEEADQVCRLLGRLQRHLRSLLVRINCWIECWVTAVSYKANIGIEPVTRGEFQPWHGTDIFLACFVMLTWESGIKSTKTGKTFSGYSAFDYEQNFRWFFDFHIIYVQWTWRTWWSNL